MTCDDCDQIAIVHLTAIRSGQTVEKHLCLACATKLSGLPAGDEVGSVPRNKLLTHLVQAWSPRGHDDR